MKYTMHRAAYGLNGKLVRHEITSEHMSAEEIRATIEHLGEIYPGYCGDDWAECYMPSGRMVKYWAEAEEEEETETVALVPLAAGA